jgi:hypothetical protein
MNLYLLHNISNSFLSFMRTVIFSKIAILFQMCIFGKYKFCISSTILELWKQYNLEPLSLQGLFMYQCENVTFFQIYFETLEL